MSGEVVWFAACTAGQCSWGTIVMRFDDQADRNKWARIHAEEFGHRVHQYHQRRLIDSE